jgi:hypothetical protein
MEYNEDLQTMKLLHLRNIFIAKRIGKYNGKSATKLNKRELIDAILNSRTERAHLRLSERFTQPFPINYGITKTGDLRKTFDSFLQSEELYVVFHIFLIINFYPKFTDYFLDILGVDRGHVCIENIIMRSHTLDEFLELSIKYPYLKTHMRSLRKQKEKELMVRYTADFTEPVPEAKLNEKRLSKITECIEDKDYLRLGISKRTYFCSEIPDICKVEMKGKKYTGHATQVIVNLKTLEAFTLESDINNENIGTVMDKIFNESIEVFLRKYVNKNIKIIAMEPEKCPKENIQGQTMLCSVWSLYLFILMLLNPMMTKEKLYSIFDSYSQHEKNMVILQFMFYVKSKEKRIFSIPGFVEKYELHPMLKREDMNLLGRV